MLGTDSAASGVRVRRCTSFVAALVDLQSSRQRTQLQVCKIGEEGPEVIKHRGVKSVGLELLLDTHKLALKKRTEFVGLELVYHFLEFLQ